jgi:putative oxidoreductase
VPGISAHIAAPITTVAELVLPVLLACGLFSRFSAAGLFIMALVIQLTYQENYQHLLWMALALSIFTKGPSLLSLDHLLVNWIRKEKPAELKDN